MTLVDILEYQPRRLQARLSRVYEYVHHSRGFVSRRNSIGGGLRFLTTDAVSTARLLTKFLRGLIGRS